MQIGNMWRLRNLRSSCLNRLPIWRNSGHAALRCVTLRYAGRLFTHLFRHCGSWDGRCSLILFAASAILSPQVAMKSSMRSSGCTPSQLLQIVLWPNETCYMKLIMKHRMKRLWKGVFGVLSFFHRGFLSIDWVQVLVQGTRRTGHGVFFLWGPDGPGWARMGQVYEKFNSQHLSTIIFGLEADPPALACTHHPKVRAIWRTSRIRTWTNLVAFSYVSFCQ